MSFHFSMEDLSLFKCALGMRFVLEAEGVMGLELENENQFPCPGVCLQ
jgi:hypothetical protein